MDKNSIREGIWDTMEEEEVGAFPFPIRGRIPNFVGSSKAADRIEQWDKWEEVDVIKANPDSPQRYLRIKALEAGKIVYMAVPKLKREKCFVRINVQPDEAKSAASISGAFDYGEPVHPSEMENIDLIITGSVAVTREGARIGKGEGYSDLELAIAYEFQKINQDTPVLTSVHPLQIKDNLPQTEHDLNLDYILTPSEFITCSYSHKEEIGINWKKLDEAKIEKIPILQQLREKKKSRE